MPPYDAVVAGLGAMGSATAAELARRGHRVLGLEQYGAGHDRGASHGGSRIIRQAYYEGRAYVPLVRRAFELWRRLEAEVAQPLLRTTGAIYAGDPAGAVLAGSLISAAAWDVPHEVLDAHELHRRFPTMHPHDHEVALFEPDAGMLPPERAVRAALAVAARYGADLRFGEPLVSWSARQGSVRVRTRAGEYDAGALVLTLGGWTGDQLGDALDLPLRVERRVQHWFAPAGAAAPWQPDRHPVWIWEFPGGASCYGFPWLDGGVKVGLHTLPGSGRTVPAGDPDREVHASDIAAVADLARQRLPDLPGRHLRGAVCTYTLTPDEHFVLGGLPGAAQVVLGCGFSGHGFKFAPVIGEILADLAMLGGTAHEIGAFDPSRPALATTAR